MICIRTTRVSPQTSSEIYNEIYVIQLAADEYGRVQILRQD